MIYREGFFLFNFVRWVDWQSFTRGLNQIWLNIREKSSKKKLTPLAYIHRDWHARNYGLKYDNFIKKISPKYGDDFGSFFFQKHALYKSKALFLSFFLSFLLPSGQISPLIKKLWFKVVYNGILWLWDR